MVSIRYQIQEIDCSHVTARNKFGFNSATMRLSYWNVAGMLLECCWNVAGKGVKVEIMEECIKTNSSDALYPQNLCTSNDYLIIIKKIDQCLR